VLAGKYRIERVLGAGGMGVVAAAYHLQLDQRIAIKFLLPEALNNPEAVARFSREARAAVKIRSEHVARVTDVGTLESGAPYMVMEFLEGIDLSEWVRLHGPLPIAQAAEFIVQACEAIAEAHSLGIIHRDLKPANLFVIRRADGTDSVKVLDFGISKLTNAASSGPDIAMTRTHTMMGSPLYMSPEQMASSRDVDAATDIWAIGATLFELLTGRAPFIADSIPQLCAMILQEPAPALRQFRPDAPEALQTVVARCLEKDRSRRYTNVAQLAHDLVAFGPERLKSSAERIGRVLQVGAASLPGPAVATSRTVEATTVGGGTQAAWGRTQSGGRRKTLLAIVGTVVLSSAVGAAVLMLAERSEEARDASSASPQPTEQLDVKTEIVPARDPAPELPPGRSTSALDAGVDAAAVDAPSAAKPAPQEAPTTAPRKPGVSRKSSTTVTAKKAATTQSTASSKTGQTATTADPTKTAPRPVDLYGDRK
jgi:serine/threonine-protein kinase